MSDFTGLGARLASLKVIVTTLPDWANPSVTGPLGADASVRLTEKADVKPLGNVTGWENVTVSERTIDRWAVPSSTFTFPVGAGVVMWKSETTGRWSVTVVKRSSTCWRLATPVSGEVFAAELTSPLTGRLPLMPNVW